MAYLRATARLISVLILFTMPVIAMAAELPLVRFDAPEGKAFEVLIEGQVQSVSLAEIEGLGVYRTKTTSPWEAGEFIFEGPLLADVVAYIGLGDAAAIRVRAIDGFTVEIPREDWLSGPAMLATRRDGALLTRRDQGPVRMVYPRLAHPAFADPVYQSRWIWLIASIEAVN